MAKNQGTQAISLPRQRPLQTFVGTFVGTFAGTFVQTLEFGRYAAQFKTPLGVACL